MCCHYMFLLYMYFHMMHFKHAERPLGFSCVGCPNMVLTTRGKKAGPMDRSMTLQTSMTSSRARKRSFSLDISNSDCFSSSSSSSADGVPSPLLSRAASVGLILLKSSFLISVGVLLLLCPCSSWLSVYLGKG